MASHRLTPAQIQLRNHASPDKARELARFFKTGPGEYGEGDVFIGVTVPLARQVARHCFAHTDEHEIKILLDSAVHEDRFLALCLLVLRYERSNDAAARAQVAAYYHRHRRGINNWDLVDTSAYKILGAHSVETGDLTVLRKLAASRHHWDRRIAMVATYAWIRIGETSLTREFAEIFLSDNEDLMHKASGWMLREVGKRDPQALLDFIAIHGCQMPRTMLRYSIEKFAENVRKKILIQTRRAV